MLELVRPHASLEPSIDQILLKTRLWLLLVGLRKSLAITTDALEQMKQHLEVTDQDFETARAEELIRRHDVMAHVHAFGAVAPAAASIMHYGATSCFDYLAKVISNLCKQQPLLHTRICSQLN
ncbi:hypothetical protein BFJ70_g11188 [Fusarium oxysporum]|nr:hypothetical protein BFJ70_g11188 [Fusarium oxysporum]